MRAGSTRWPIFGLLILVGCGGPRVPASSSAGCDAARVAAADAWVEVAERTEASRGEDTPPTALEILHASLTEHLRELRRVGTSDPDESLRLSGELMDGIDAAEMPEPLRARADFAAEGLLAERGTGAVRATETALRVLEEILEHLRPGFIARGASRAALDELLRRAQRTVLAYEHGVPAGDRAADRAEAAELPDLPELTELRDRAREASQHARLICEVPRTLSVPTGS